MNTPINDTNFASKFSKSIVNHPWRYLLIFAISLGILVPGILRWKSIYSARMWFAENHPNMQRLEAFEKQFGADQTIILGVYNKDGIFNPKTIGALRELSDRMWQIKDVIRVESLANYTDISSTEDDINIGPLLPDDMELSNENLERVRDHALADKTIPDIFLSKDATYSPIYGYLRPSLGGNDPDFKQIVKESREVVEEFEAKYPDIKIFLIGEAAGNDSFREVSAHDNQRIIPFMMFFLIILLYLLFHSFVAVFIPITLVAITIAVTYGYMGWLGITFNSLLAAIPGVMLAICLADSIHILLSFFHFRHEKVPTKLAIQYSLTRNFLPTFLTSFSTAISFYTLTITEILPIWGLGLLSGFGTMMAWIYTYILIGPIMALLARRFDMKPGKWVLLFQNDPSQSEKKRKRASREVKAIHRFRWPIIIASTFLTGISLYVALKNEVNSDPIKYFDTEVPVRAAYDFASTKMNGLRGTEVVIDAEREDGVKDPDFLRKVDAFTNILLADSEITGVKSILGVIKRMNRTLHGDDENFYTIPDSQAAVAEILFLYSVGLPAGSDLNHLHSLDYKQLRLRVVWGVETSKESEAKINWLEAKARELGLVAHAAGNVPIYVKMNTQVVTSFFSSIALALLLVGTMIFVVFRDLKISLLSMVPNVVPLIIGGAVMKAMGQYIDIGTSLVYTVCLGIAVDDSIHFIASYQSYRKQGMSPTVAITEVFSLTGKALIVTTLLLTVGFGSFIFADFLPNRNFGVLCSIILLIALLCDLLLLPAILMVTDREGETKEDNPLIKNEEGPVTI